MNDRTRSRPKSRNSKKRGPWWRAVTAGVCVAIAVVSLVGAVLTRYVQRNVLDTNGYLAIIGPLPEDPQVSAALAKFTTEKIFDATNAEASIKEFLPPRLAPLANPLAEALERRFNQTANNFVQSDTFNSIWTTANRALQKGVLRVAESKEGEGKLAALGSLDLSRLASAIKERIGSDTAITPEQQEKAATIRVDLKQRVDRLRTNVRIINNGAYVLPYLALSFLVAAVAIGYNRRRVILAIGITMMILGVAMLVTFKVASGGVLGDIADATYKSAAQVIYEAFYNDLRSRIVLIIISGAVVALLALLAGPYRWAAWLRNKLALPKFRNIAPYRWLLNIRRVTAKYEVWFELGAAVAVIIWLLALSSLTPATLVVILSLLVAFVSLAHIVARPAPVNLR
ncbi:MAG TPA: hypothetical protein VIS56_00005 [Candidatus Saccharimonadales bacterium]